MRKDDDYVGRRIKNSGTKNKTWTMIRDDIGLVPVHKKIEMVGTPGENGLSKGGGSDTRPVGRPYSR